MVWGGNGPIRVNKEDGIPIDCVSGEIVVRSELRREDGVPTHIF